MKESSFDAFTKELEDIATTFDSLPLSSLALTDTENVAIGKLGKEYMALIDEVLGKYATKPRNDIRRPLVLKAVAILAANLGTIQRALGTGIRYGENQ